MTSGTLLHPIRAPLEAPSVAGSQAWPTLQCFLKILKGLQDPGPVTFAEYTLVWLHQPSEHHLPDSETPLCVTHILPDALSVAVPYRQMAGGGRPCGVLCLFLSSPRPGNS